MFSGFHEHPKGANEHQSTGTCMYMYVHGTKSGLHVHIHWTSYQLSIPIC